MASMASAATAQIPSVSSPATPPYTFNSTSINVNVPGALPSKPAFPANLPTPSISSADRSTSTVTVQVMWTQFNSSNPVPIPVGCRVTMDGDNNNSTYTTDSTGEVEFLKVPYGSHTFYAEYDTLPRDWTGAVTASISHHLEKLKIIAT